MGNLPGCQGCPGDLDHRTDHVPKFRLALLHDLLSDSVNNRFLIDEFFRGPHQGDHDFRRDLDFFFTTLDDRFKDRSGLHGCNFRMGDSQSAAPMAQHGVELRQEVGLGSHGLDRNTKTRGHLFLCRFFMRDELV